MSQPTAMTEFADDAPEPTDATEAQRRKFQRELSAGLTSLVLLSVLADADEDLSGYEIARQCAREQGLNMPMLDR